VIADQRAPRQGLLATDSLRVEFGALVAVRDVSLSLAAGDLLGLIGPNGAGKTTLLRAITGLQPPTRGTVHILDQRLRFPASDPMRYIGFSPDTPWVYEELTVRKFLHLIAKGYGLDGPAIDESIDFWLEKVWLLEKANQKIKALSRGMRQRVSIARTLLPNPAVVLLDEPAAGLDPAGRVQFRQLLCNLRDQGKALIVSSHILADMDEYCTHIAIMSAGSIVQYGTVHQIAHGTDVRRCRYSLSLAHPVAALGELLSSIAGVDSVQVDGQSVSLQFFNDKEQAAALLAELIGRRIPVASFAPHAVDLEEVYLKTGIRQVD